MYILGIGAGVCMAKYESARCGTVSSLTVA